MFCIAGSSRSGKTTTAKAVAKELGLEFRGSAFYQRVKDDLGIDLVSNLSFADRLKGQQHALKVWLEEFPEADADVITDRSALDFCSYLFAEVNMHTDPSHSDAAMAFFHDCRKAMSDRCFFVHILRPLDNYKEEENKAPRNKASQFALQMVLEGLATELPAELPVCMIVETGLKERVEQICENISTYTEHCSDMKDHVTIH